MVSLPQAVREPCPVIADECLLAEFAVTDFAANRRQAADLLAA